MRKWIGTIQADDSETGVKIRLYAVRAEYDGLRGYRLEAGNGDDIGYYIPQKMGKCIQDMQASWGQWRSFRDRT